VEPGSELGNPLRNQLSDFFARNNAAFVGRFDPARNGRSRFGIDFDFVFGRSKRSGLASAIRINQDLGFRPV
jgi:hypothetical protein